MRVAIIKHSKKNNISKIKDIFSRVSNVEILEFFIDEGKIFTQEGERTTLQNIVETCDTYIFSTTFPHFLRENIMHYFDVHNVPHLYGKMNDRVVVSDEFLLTKSVQVDQNYQDIEHIVAKIWSTMLHPIRLKNKHLISKEIHSVSDLRIHALPRMIQGEMFECVYQPKGRNLVCTLLRNVRGKKVYTTPLFEKITQGSQEKIFSSSLSFMNKQKIIAKLEELFSHYPTIPTLHVELVHTQKGLYIVHATPLNVQTTEMLPHTLHAVGVGGHDIVASCVSILPSLVSTK